MLTAQYAVCLSSMVCRLSMCPRSKSLQVDTFWGYRKKPTRIEQANERLCHRWQNYINDRGS